MSFGNLCKDIFGRSLSIKGKTVISSNKNLSVKNAKVDGKLIVQDDVLIKGNLIINNSITGGSSVPIILTGNTYSIEENVDTIIIPNMYCFGKISNFNSSGPDPGEFVYLQRTDGKTVGFAEDAFMASTASIFTYEGGNVWSQKGTTLNTNSIRGIALSNNGDTVVFGGNDGADVFDWNGTIWVQRGSTITDAVIIQDYDKAVIMSESGNSFIAGDRSYSNIVLQSGQAKVFYWNGTSWIQRGSTLYGVDVINNFFGGSVYMTGDGDTIAVGSRTYTEVYDWDSGSSDWVQRGQSVGLGIFIAVDGNNSISLSQDGNTLLIASTSEGLVWDWNSTSGMWKQRGASFTKIGVLIESCDISYDGNRVVLGDILNTRFITFDWNGASWVETNDIDTGTTTTSVSMSGDGHFIGVVSRSPPLPSADFAEIWCLQDSIVEIDFPDVSENLGRKISISSDKNFVESTENNIIRLFNFNNTNDILGNTEQFAIVQSDGSSWIRIL